MATFVVATAADNGDDAAPIAGSLRDAIIRANGRPGPDRITFDIGAGGPQTIAPTAPLPALTDPAEVDGSTQPGFAGTPLIELNGANAGGSFGGLVLQAGQSTVRSLAVNRFSGNGLVLQGNGNRVVGNVIGTDRTGTIDFGNGGNGLLVSSTNNSIGGSAPGESNVISGNEGSGIQLDSVNLGGNNLILGNRVGTDPSGTRPLGNQSAGIRSNASQNVIGGVGAGEANTIAFNGTGGVLVGFFFTGEQANAIRGNAIFRNGGLGIDLSSDGVTPNDSFDFDGGPNGRQNFPVIFTAFPGPAGGTTVQGRLDSRPGQSYSIDFFSNDQPDASTFGEGQLYLGSAVAVTGPDGRADFAFDLPGAVAPGRFLTATATDAVGNTSEFSEARLVADAARADLSAALQLPATARIGEETTLSASISNLGPARATGASLAVALPTGFDFVVAQPDRGTATFANGVVTLAAGTLLASESATVSIRAVPRAVGVASLSATASAAQADPVAENSTARATFDVLPPVPADLAIVASTQPTPATVGQPFEYTAVVVNGGPNARADGVVATIELPEGVEVRGITPSQGTAARDGRVVTAQLGPLDRFANATVRLTLVPSTTDRLAIVARVQSGAPDPDALNNAARTEVDVSALPPVTPSDLDVSAFLSAGQPVLGETFEYTAIVNNFGPAARASGVELTVELPEGVELVSASPSQGTATPEGRAVRVQLGELAAFANAVVRLSLRATASGSADVVASVRSDRPDPNALNNATRTPLTILPAQLADVAVSISATPPSPRIGETITYALTVANNGPGDAEGVVLVNDLPDDVEIVSPPGVSQGTIEQAGGVLTARLGTLAPGQRAILSYTVRPRSTGTLTNAASLTTDRPDPDPSNNRVELITPVGAAEPADLAVAVVAVPEPAPVGAPLKYTVVTSNAGPAAATGTRIRLPLPSGLELTGIRPSQGTASLGPDGVLTIDLGSLAPGGRALVELTVVPRAIGPLELAATVESSGPDFDPTNNRSVSRTEAVAEDRLPKVSGQTLVSGPGGISAVVLAFSRPLDPALAGLVGNYSIRLDGARGRSIPIRSATYDPLARTVTLVPSRPLSLGRFYRIQANAPGGPGLVGVDGQPLDGDFNGLPDGIYEDVIGRGTHTRPARLQRGPASRTLRPTDPPAPLPPAPNGAAARALAARAARFAGRGD